MPASAFAAGVGVASGQAPLGLWPVAVVSLAWLIRQIAGAPTPRSAALVGLAGGTGHFVLALSWIVEPFLIDAARHGWMAPFALILMAVGMALFWAGAAAAGVALARASGGREEMLRTGIAVAVVLAASDLARGYVLTGFPWALIGHIWIGTPLDQVAALIGPAGLSLMTALAAAGIATASLAGGAVAVALLGAATGFGALRLATPAPADRPLTVRLVQPHADQAEKWNPSAARSHFDILLSLTAEGPRPNLIVWPETSVPYLMDDYPEVAQAIATAAAGPTVIVGHQRVSGAQAWNAMSAIGPAGTVLAQYDKHHLVPFGEYVPFGDLAYRLFGIGAFAANIGNGYSAGPGPRVLDLSAPVGRFLPLICYEAVFPQDLRTNDRPDWLLQITNDAWFGTVSGPYQHLAQARLRTIEQGLPMVRVANTGVSAVIDARGRVTARIELGARAYRDATLPGARAPTPYARFGEGPVLLLLAAIGAALLARRRSGRA